MHELLHWASAARLPIVMAEVNRALAPGWNIWMDQTDSLAQRDTGWIQLYCEDGQEVLDTTLQAFRLAEWVSLPVMVVLDAFYLSHTYEPVDVPDQENVDRFLPPFSPRIQLDPQNPKALGQLAPPSVYMNMRHNIQKTMEQVQYRLEQVEQDFAGLFDRAYGPVEAVDCEDARIILVMSGTAASTCRQVIADLRTQGEKVGMLKIKMFRPFPTDLIRRILGPAQKIAVVDRNFSFGASGIFAQEVRAALCNLDGHPPVFGYIAGIGGRDVTPELLVDIYRSTQNQAKPETESVWVGMEENP
jgi:pyruvate/2-oxoacid:ferredoxin oxidoreductase alpha subunit